MKGRFRRYPARFLTRFDVLRASEAGLPPPPKPLLLRALRLLSREDYPRPQGLYNSRRRLFVEKSAAVRTAKRTLNA